MIRSLKSTIQEAWLKISAESIFHRDAWLCNETILQTIKACYTPIPKAVNINCKTINAARTPLAGLLNRTNIHGFYKKSSKPSAPMMTMLGERCTITTITCIKNSVTTFLASDVEDIVARSTWVINNQERISAQEKKRNNCDKAGKAIEGLESENTKEQKSAKQQQQQKDSTDKGKI